ncbi:MAG: sugar ABC transporter permease [Sphaerochaetaceae bacterium]|nr:sugar ABC transporter permease [Sphaerochaetaceae bacterium]
MKSILKPKKSIFIVYLIIPVLIYFFVIILPIISASYYSLFKWSGGPKMKFIGLSNYDKLIHDVIFWKSFLNNLTITIICIVGQIGIALILALFINSKAIKLKKAHLAVSYFPVILSAVVVGYIWSMLYDYNNGLLNSLLKLVGADNLVRPWLSDSNLALLLVSFPLIWKNIGYFLIIILSGLSSFDKSILEMSEIDGATSIKKFWFITLPMLRKTLVVCLTLCISGNMKVFDHIYVMTGGGPGTSTMVMALHAYQNSFVRYKMGYGSSLSIGILVLSIFITMLARKITLEKSES